MQVTYRKRDNAGEWFTFHVEIDDDKWEAFFDLTNKHFCSDKPVLPWPPKGWPHGGK